MCDIKHCICILRGPNRNGLVHNKRSGERKSVNKRCEHHVHSFIALVGWCYLLYIVLCYTCSLLTYILYLQVYSYSLGICSHHLFLRFAGTPQTLYGLSTDDSVDLFWDSYFGGVKLRDVTIIGDVLYSFDVNMTGNWILLLMYSVPYMFSVLSQDSV